MEYELTSFKLYLMAFKTILSATDITICQKTKPWQVFALVNTG